MEYILETYNLEKNIKISKLFLILVYMLKKVLFMD